LLVPESTTATVSGDPGVLTAYVAHYSEHRPHRALGQRPPLATPTVSDERRLANVIDLDLDRVRRRDRLGELIHEYQLAA